jgi:hypothetical protein
MLGEGSDIKWDWSLKKKTKIPTSTTGATYMLSTPIIHLALDYTNDYQLPNWWKRKKYIFKISIQWAWLWHKLIGSKDHKIGGCNV